MYILTKEFLIENVIKEDEKTIEEVINFMGADYTLRQIPKAHGERTIYEMKRHSDLYRIQKNIQKNFLSKIPLPVCVKGFCKESSYADFLSVHKNKKYYIRLDIKDFFGSIQKEQVYDSLAEYVKQVEALEILVDLCMYEGILPQGAVTSPAISNIIFRRVDQRITKYCQKLDVVYTRYADDLIFSSDQIDFKRQKWFYKKIKYILRENGFLINLSKIHLQEGALSLNGFVLDTEVSLSRKKLNNLNKIIYYFKDKTKKGEYKVDPVLKSHDYLEEINQLELRDRKKNFLFFKNKLKLINYLCGYRSFLLEIAYSNQELKNDKVEQMLHKVDQIQKIVDWLS